MGHEIVLPERGRSAPVQPFSADSQRRFYAADYGFEYAEYLDGRGIVWPLGQLTRWQRFKRWLGGLCQ